MSDDVRPTYPPNTGLFLGAGASYELGMPLVSGVTQEIRDALVPGGLRSLNDGWRRQGGGFPDAIIEDVLEVLQAPDMHYESMLAHLESQARRAQRRVPTTDQNLADSQAYSGLYQRLVETVYNVLYLRHLKYEGLIAESMCYFEGLAEFASHHTPLWVFSLNHDLMVECIAAHSGVEVCCGLTGFKAFPRRDRTGAIIGELYADTIRDAELKQDGLRFLPRGTKGINLIKIHGALDVFYENDANDLVKLRPGGPGVHGYIESLHAANEELIYIRPWMTAPAKAVNYVAYEDTQQELQIMGRSLLAGAKKFDQPQRGRFPGLFLDAFKWHINSLTALVCVGYGFGDAHINDVIRQWLDFSADRKLDIVRPGEEGSPRELLDYARQITIRRQAASDFFQRFAARPLSDAERTAKSLRTSILTRGFENALREAQEPMILGVNEMLNQIGLTYTVDRLTGKTVVDFATTPVPGGVDLVPLVGLEKVIAYISRWLLSEQTRVTETVTFGNPLRDQLQDPTKRSETMYRRIVVLAQQDIVSKQSADGESTEANTVASLLLASVDIERPNPAAPAVEIDTLHITVVTLDGARTDFTVEFGFPAPA